MKIRLDWDLLLLKEIAKYPHLYQPEYRHCTHIDERNACWIKVTRAVFKRTESKDVQTVKKRWHTIREGYVRTMKSRYNAAQGEDISVPIVHCYDKYMEFLNNYLDFKVYSLNSKKLNTYFKRRREMKVNKRPRQTENQRDETESETTDDVTISEPDQFYSDEDDVVIDDTNNMKLETSGGQTYSHNGYNSNMYSHASLLECHQYPTPPVSSASNNYETQIATITCGGFNSNRQGGSSDESFQNSARSRSSTYGNGVGVGGGSGEMNSSSSSTILTNDNEKFFLCLAQSVKKLNPLTAARIKKEIANLIMDAEIEELQSCMMPNNLI